MPISLVPTRQHDELDPPDQECTYLALWPRSSRRSRWYVRRVQISFTALSRNVKPLWIIFSSTNCPYTWVHMVFLAWYCLREGLQVLPENTIPTLKTEFIRWGASQHYCIPYEYLQHCSFVWYCIPRGWRRWWPHIMQLLRRINHADKPGYLKKLLDGRIQTSYYFSCALQYQHPAVKVLTLLSKSVVGCGMKHQNLRKSRSYA